jgi:hypothetical protein
MKRSASPETFGKKSFAGKMLSHRRPLQTDQRLVFATSIVTERVGVEIMVRAEV